MASRNPALIERFASKVDMGAQPSDCWRWRGSSMVTGYGILTYRKAVGRQYLLAHRVSYELFRGAIPGGLMVRHACDNKRCVNPRHLLVGTAADNQRDRWERGRPNIGELHGMHRLTDQAVREIRAAKRRGVRSVDLAREYGVSLVTINCAARGARWKHVQEVA